MVTDKTEEEQIEAIKRWWSENGTSLIVGIVLALAAVLGYQSWQTGVRESGEEASALYEDLLDTVLVGQNETLDEDRLSTAQFIVDQLKTEHEGSTYAHFAAMFMAKIAGEQGDLETAESELRWVLDNDAERSIALIARPRLAGVLLARDRPEEALRLVEGVDAGAHASTFEEVKGDIYLALGRQEDARQAYQRAVDTIVGDLEKPILKMKLANLAEPETVILETGTGTAPATGEAGESETGAN